MGREILKDGIAIKLKKNQGISVITWNQEFKSFRKVIPKSGENNKISPTTASFYFLEVVSRLQHREGEPKEIPEDSLS